MNWSEVKSILIIFFLIINTIFFGILIESDKSIYNVNPESVKSTVDILEKSQITIKEDIIPKKNPKMQYAEAYNIIEDNMQFAQSVLGGDVTEDNGRYISPAGELTVNGDFFTINYFDKNYFDIASYPNIDKKIERIFKRIGFENIGKYKTVSEINGNVYNVTVKNIINSKYFFDSEINIVMTPGSVDSISGVWFIPNSDITSEIIETQSVTGVLINFMNTAKNNNYNLPINITNLSIGYYKGEPEVYHKSFVLIPVWCIETSDGGKYYIDTRRTQ